MQVETAARLREIVQPPTVEIGCSHALQLSPRPLLIHIGPERLEGSAPCAIFSRITAVTSGRRSASIAHSSTHAMCMNTVAVSIVTSYSILSTAKASPQAVHVRGPLLRPAQIIVGG